MKISHSESIKENILKIGEALDKKYSPYSKGNQYKLSKLLHRYSFTDVIATAKYVNMKFKNTNYYEWSRKPNIFLQDRFDEFYEEMKRRTPQFIKEIIKKESKEHAEDRNRKQRI
jgi:hypothetical protein